MTPNIPMPSTKAQTEQMAMIGSEQHEQDDRLGRLRLDEQERDEHHRRQRESSVRRAVEVHRTAWPTSAPDSSGTTVPIGVANPAQSSLRRAARLHVRKLEVDRRHRDFGAHRQGLTQKQARHDQWSVSQPPSRGAEIYATPQTAANSPGSAPRLAEKMSPTIVNSRPIHMPAPTP